MDTNQTKTAENQTAHVVPPLGGSSIGSPTIIPQHILDHAERHYPSASRPKCPIYSRNWDLEKQHCIDNRLKIEAELAAQKDVTQTSEPACLPTKPAPSNVPRQAPTPKPYSPSKPTKSPNIQDISGSFSQNISKPLPPKSPPIHNSHISHISHPSHSPKPNLTSANAQRQKPSVPGEKCPMHKMDAVPQQPQITNSQFSILNSQSAPTSEIRNPRPAINPDPTPTPIPNPTLTLARVLQSAAARKHRPDDKFAALTEDDRQQLIAWLQSNTFDTVLQLAVKPRQEGGLDFETSRTALHNFYHKHDLNDRLQSAIDILEAAQSNLPTGSPNPLEQTLELLVHAQATRTASQPITERALPHFLRHITRLRELQLRDRAITLRQKSLAFRMQTQGCDITKKAMEKLPELNEIVANKNITPRQAMAQGYIQVFGQGTYDYMQEANRKYAEQNPTEPDYDPTPDETSLEPKRTETEIFRLMLEFPDTPMPQIRAIAAQRRANNQPITANPDDLNIV